MLEDVKQGAVIRRTLLVDGEKEGAGTQPLQIGTTLMCKSAETLLKNFRYEDGPEIPNIDQIVNFGATPYNVGDDNNLIYHWTPCNFLNHKPGKGANVILALSAADPNHARVVALRDIAAGEELFQDYRSFKFPDWYTEWCRDATDGHKVDTNTLGHMVSPKASIPVMTPENSTSEQVAKAEDEADNKQRALAKRALKALSELICF